MARPGITQAMVLSKPQRSNGQEYLRLALYDEELNHINLIEMLESGGGGVGPQGPPGPPGPTGDTGPAGPPGSGSGTAGPAWWPVTGSSTFDSLSEKPEAKIGDYFIASDPDGYSVYCLSTDLKSGDILRATSEYGGTVVGNVMGGKRWWPVTSMSLPYLSDDLKYSIGDYFVNVGSENITIFGSLVIKPGEIFQVAGETAGNIIGGFASTSASGHIAIDALPNNPATYQEAYLRVGIGLDSTKWLMQAQGSNRWDFMGGAPFYKGYSTPNPTALTGNPGVWTPLPNSPVIDLPYPGDYDIDFGGVVSHSVNGASVSITPFATGLDIGDWRNELVCQQPAGANGGKIPASRSMKTDGTVDISGSLSLGYSQSAAGGSIERAYLKVTPRILHDV